MKSETVLFLVSLSLLALMPHRGSGLEMDSSALSNIMFEAKAKADLHQEQRLTNGARRRKATPEYVSRIILLNIIC